MIEGLDPPVCGTVRGFLAHLHMGKEPCPSCRAEWDDWSIRNRRVVHKHTPRSPRKANQGGLQWCSGCRQYLPQKAWSPSKWGEPATRCRTCRSEYERFRRERKGS